MRIIRPSDRQVVEGTSNLFVGGTVGREWLIDDKIAAGLKVILVKFSPGARTKWHTHTSEQLLWVTEGKGVVATKKEEQDLTSGTIAYIPVGEIHWHGATSDTPLAHLSITTPGKTDIVE